ncbi:hypothetical protein ACMFMG_011297 [Clarireedia jacksonii]
MLSHIKQIVKIRRRSPMTRLEFFDYYFKVHGALSTAPSFSETPEIYHQTNFFDSSYRSNSSIEPAYFGHDDMTELYYKDFDHVGKVFSSEHIRKKVGPDGVNFNDMSSTLSMFSKEETLYASDTSDGMGSVAKYHLQGFGEPDNATSLAADIKSDFIVNLENVERK